MKRCSQSVVALLTLILMLAGPALFSGCTGEQETGSTSETRLEVPAPSADSTVLLDVPYVSTPQEVVERMLELAEVSEEDVVYDLGSGDGRIVITAAQQFGARGVGIEIDPQRVQEARINAEAAGVSDQVEFRHQDLFKADFSEATVVTLYLLSVVNKKLRPKLFEQLDPGDRVVSHDFDMGAWAPDTSVEVGDSEIYLWTMPKEMPNTLRHGERGASSPREGT